MASEKQLAANRANAKRSTGPKTKEGKARSRANAWKHGVTAEYIVLCCEDPAEFNGLRAELWEEFRPRPGLESVLVDRLAAQSWRLRRVSIFEGAALDTCCFNIAQDEARAAAWRARASESEAEEQTDEAEAQKEEEEFEPGQYLGEALLQDQDTLAKLSRYEAALMSGITKTLQMLLLLQSRPTDARGRPLREEPRTIDAVRPQEKSIPKVRLTN